MNGKIKMSLDAFPAFLWSGTPPGADFDRDNVLEGMLKGYFLGRVSQADYKVWTFTQTRQVMRHIFRGASSAFGEEPSGSRSCNAELHDMSTVVAPNIAYACLQVCNIE